MTDWSETFARLSAEEQEQALTLLATKKHGGQLAPPRKVQQATFMNQEFPELDFLVEGMVARGHLVLLGGRPKSGKSWFVLQLAHAVDTQRPFLGRKTQPARVALLALEGGPASLHRRMSALGWRTPNVDIYFDIAPFDGSNGTTGPGLGQVAGLAKQYDLLILDTLVRALSGQANENDNTTMGAIVNELAAAAHDNNCAIVMVHHTGKGFNEDVFNTPRGASAIRGGYDVGMVLVRRDDEREAALHIEARDFPTENIAIRQQAGGVMWELIGRIGEIRQIRAGRKVVEALEALGEATAEDISKFLGQSKRSIHAQLKRAERDGLVVRSSGPVGKRGRPPELWSLVEPASADPTPAHEIPEVH